MTSKIKVWLRKGKAGPALGRHPWVFAGAILRLEGTPRDGDEVEVCSDDGRFIGHGLFQSTSEIRVRLYSWNEAEGLDDTFWKNRIREAVRLRKEVLGLSDPNGACRMIFSEGDGLSGLTADRYGTYWIVQLTSGALAKRIEILTEAIREAGEPKGIYLRASPHLIGKEGLEKEDRVLWGEIPNEAVWIRDGSLNIPVLLRGGQKTAMYLDQSENRRAVGRLSKGKSVLDLYCHQGGFSFHAAAAGAARSLGIDSSTAALSLAEMTAQRNGLSDRTSFQEADVFDFLKTQPGGKEAAWDVVIVDPPRLASSREGKDSALRMYYSLNTEALKAIRPGGIFVSCNCSGRVSLEDWLHLLSSVASRSHRSLQILEVRGPSMDHPVSAHCLEGQYLKCVIGRVMS